MAVAGSLTYDTKIDKDGFNKGLKNIESSIKSGGTKIKNIVSALGITKLVSTAISTINSSIDGAVSRIDTLNNFPKVMTNLGIASEDSEKAVKKLSDGLQGIPTTLDSASLAVQRFTSVNGDVDKSTEYFLALNNALLAGGASADIQSSAMEQLSQSYAKGKPDMIEWRSLQTAMPAQLKQVAQAFNMTTDELGEALRSGKLSMNDFMDKIVELNKNGTGQFQSFAEQAKNSTGGIKTSITNAKTAITRGVANIVKAFDEALKSNGLGGISTVISNIGKIAENVLKKVASLIPKAVSKIKDIYNWTKKNQDLIKNLIKIVASLTAGYIAYKTVLIAINTIQTAKKILNTASAFLSLIPTIRSAKDAMLLLNMSFSANPVGLVVAGVTALTTALVLFGSRQTEAQKEAKDFSEEMKNSKKAFEEYNQSIDKVAKANISQINSVKTLKDELKLLVDENGRVKQGYEGRVDFILNELNQALGTEYTKTGNIINNYKQLQKEIDILIEKKKAQIILEASEEKYRNAINEEEGALENLKEATSKLIKVKEEYGMSLEQLREKAENSYGKEKEYLNNIINAYDDATQVVKENTEAQKQYTDNYTLYVNGEYEKIGNSIVATTSNWTNGTLNTLKEGIEKQATELEEWKAVYEVAETEMAKTQKENAEKNLRELAQNLEDRTSTVTNLGANEYSAWKALAESNYRIYSEQLEKMNPDMRKKIEDLTGYLQGDTSLPEGMEMLVRKTTSTFEEKMKFLLSGTDDKLDDIEIKFKNNIDIPNAAGMLAMKTGEAIENDTTVSRAAFILANNANKQFNNNIDGKKWGSDLSENISKGMTSTDSLRKVNSAASFLAGLIKKNIGHSVPEEGPLKDELTYMPDMIDNLVKGIEKNKYKVAKATKELAGDIKDSFNLENLNNVIIKEMQKAVSIETGSINAKAILQANKEQPIVIARDTQNTINNTQNFYNKEATPYEQQREAKQQLRRLAYGL